MNKQTKRQALAELEEMYPEAKAELVFSNPYEMLVATILSAQCTDRQVNKVTPAVFERWPDACAMADAKESELYPLVKSCGFKTKAAHIIAACKMIRDQYGGRVPDTREALTALPGVGRKTANVVLSNAFGLPAFAVDTHVFRVCNRIGLCRAGTVEETEKQMTRLIPEDKWGQAHHWLIWHGRRVCKAVHPLCGECRLREMCEYARQAGKKADSQKDQG